MGRFLDSHFQLSYLRSLLCPTSASCNYAAGNVSGSLTTPAPRLILDKIFPFEPIGSILTRGKSVGSDPQIAPQSPRPQAPDSGSLQLRGREREQLASNSCAALYRTGSFKE